MIEKKQKQLSIERQCELMEVSHSSFYYTPVEESKDKLVIMHYPDEQYLQTAFYGYRKLTALLTANGYAVNEKRVGRLMELVGWQTIYQAPETSIAAVGPEVYPYLLKGLPIVHRNQVWLSPL